MASTDELKRRIDLHDLAERLGLERPGGRGNYRSPSHPDKQPSLSVYRGKTGELAWKDHSTGEGGSCIDLVMVVRGCDAAGAIRELHQLYGLPLERPANALAEPRREKSKAEYIAERCLAAPARVLEYLQSRGITKAAIEHAIAQRALGWNDWKSDKVPAGEHGHGGPAAAFIVRTLNPGHVMAVDFRYVDPALNGGTKTQCQGEKFGYGWTADVKRLEKARTVYVVESPINALSIDSAALGGPVATFATRGTGNVRNIDWRWCRNKRVVICMDNDAPFGAEHRLAGIRPGLQAAWQLHEILTTLDVSAQLVDQEEWTDVEGKPINDVNDLLKAKGPEGLARALRNIEQWLIPGMGGDLEQMGKPRVYLPYHDAAQYPHYRVREDFTTFFTEKKATDELGNETKTPHYSDLCGFRIAAISRVTIQGATATVTGDPDTQPNVAFAVAVQVPRHGPVLQRRVVEDERLHNVDMWKRFGPVWNQAAFLRSVSILERAAGIGERVAANFVGLCYRDGELVVNEGTDTYFMDPKQQCPYYNLIFPAGQVADARTVIGAFQSTFQRNAAALALVWALGAHMKVFLGFWPHLEMQADKGHGKSTLAARLERAVGMKVFSRETLKTPFRLITTTAHTSQPIGWEELSANSMQMIDAAVATLQEAYNFKPSPRGAQMLEFLTCAPVLLIGEDVPVRSLIGKLVRTQLTGRKGDMLPEDLPRFPVRQWLEFLARQSRAHVKEVYDRLREHCVAHCRASNRDDGAMRMAGNYAAVLTAWRFLAEFSGIEVGQGEFGTDLIAEMNAHVAETSTDREPWVWIVETLLSEIAANRFMFPYLWDEHLDPDTRRKVPALLVRPAHVMDYLSSSVALREKWNALPVKSARVFARQLEHAGVVIDNDTERTIETDGVGNRKRVSHLFALALERLERYGLHAVPVGRADLLERPTALPDVPEHGFDAGFDSPAPPHE